MVHHPSAQRCKLHRARGDQQSVTWTMRSAFCSLNVNLLLSWMYRFQTFHIRLLGQDFFWEPLDHPVALWIYPLRFQIEQTVFQYCHLEKDFVRLHFGHYHFCWGTRWILKYFRVTSLETPYSRVCLKSLVGHYCLSRDHKRYLKWKIKIYKPSSKWNNLG